MSLVAIPELFHTAGAVVSAAGAALLLGGHHRQLLRLPHLLQETHLQEDSLKPVTSSTPDRCSSMMLHPRCSILLATFQQPLSIE